MNNILNIKIKDKSRAGNKIKGLFNKIFKSKSGTIGDINEAKGIFMNMRNKILNKTPNDSKEMSY